MKTNVLLGGSLSHWEASEALCADCLSLTVGRRSLVPPAWAAVTCPGSYSLKGCSVSGLGPKDAGAGSVLCSPGGQPSPLSDEESEGQSICLVGGGTETQSRAAPDHVL